MNEGYRVRWNHSNEPDFIGVSGPWNTLSEAVEIRDNVYKLFTNLDREKDPIVIILDHPSDKDEQRRMYTRFIYAKFFYHDRMLN